MFLEIHYQTKGIIEVFPEVKVAPDNLKKSAHCCEFCVINVLHLLVPENFLFDRVSKCSPFPLILISH
jgi:hypothetical protein